MRDADQLLIGEQHPEALVAVFEQNLKAGLDQFAV